MNAHVAVAAVQARVDALWVNILPKFASWVIPGVIQTIFEFRISDQSKSPEAGDNAATAAREAHFALIVAQAQAAGNAHAAVAAVQAEVDAPSWYLEVEIKNRAK